MTLACHLKVRGEGFKVSLVLAVWVAVVVGSFAWNLYQAERSRAELALEMARSFFDLLVIARRWNARHGGVYAPVGGETQPNPQLDDPPRDIQVSDALTLTKINPAYMTRQLGEIAAEAAGVQFRITSLKPLRLSNAATPWETEALRAFEQGVEEVGEFFSDDGRPGYRYMAPLITEKPCLKCHEVQGYEGGDVRGGISVRLYSIAPVSTVELAVSHLLIGTIGAGFVLLMGLMSMRAYRELRRQAALDALTGIPNRRCLLDHLEREMRRCRREGWSVSLLMCDIDYFKAYNDSLGHLAGDRCLRAVARSIESSVRRGADFCARYGGEEFVTLLPATDSAGAALIGEKIRAGVASLAISHPHSPLGVVTISVGVVSARGEEMSAETLMRRADEAMYRAKEAGRNRVVVDREAVLESLSSRGSTRSGGRAMTLPLTAPDASSEAPG